MKLLALYPTETDWCALVMHRERQLTLTYAQPPDESQVLEDAEAAFAALDAAPPDLPSLDVDESSSADEKREQLLSQVTAMRTFVETHADAFADAEALDAAFADMAALVTAQSEAQV